MKKLFSSLTVVGLLAGIPGAGSALTLFAQVNQSAAGTPYYWVNDGLFPGSGAFGITPAPLSVNFQFQLPVPVIGTNIVPAVLTINAVDNGPFFLSQPIRWFSFQILATNPAHWYLGNNVLLETIMPVPLPNGIEGDIVASGITASLSSDFARGLVMRSDYINIDPNQDQTAVWSFSNVNPAPLAADPINGILRTTLFGGNGNFSAHVSNIIPEPGAVALLIGFGVTGGLLATRRRAR